MGVQTGIFNNKATSAHQVNTINLGTLAAKKDQGVSAGIEGNAARTLQTNNINFSATNAGGSQALSGGIQGNGVTVGKQTNNIKFASAFAGGDQTMEGFISKNRAFGEFQSNTINLSGVNAQAKGDQKISTGIVTNWAKLGQTNKINLGI